MVAASVMSGAHMGFSEECVDVGSGVRGGGLCGSVSYEEEVHVRTVSQRVVRRPSEQGVLEKTAVEEDLRIRGNAYGNPRHHLRPGENSEGAAGIRCVLDEFPKIPRSGVPKLPGAEIDRSSKFVPIFIYLNHINPFLDPTEPRGTPVSHYQCCCSARYAFIRYVREKIGRSALVGFVLL